ncbi:MAG: type II toxin-antitoxin system RelE/ParE family toxin [Pseudomonadales bacterium]|nr:type II toxin-antitoxin system RelE/ParE family toxin [Pseudomonadales bacterium]
MRLKLVERALWSIYAPVINDTDSAAVDCVEEFLETHMDAHEGSCSGLIAQMEEAIKHVNGPKALGNKLCHHVSLPDEPKIYEFIKGRLRLFWFYGKGEKIIICSHGLFKNTKKTPRAEVKKALKFREKYFDSEKNKTIIICEE